MGRRLLPVLAATLGLATATSARGDYLSGEKLTNHTQAVMWPAYGTFVATLFQEMRRPTIALPVSRRRSGTTAWLLAGVGGALFIAGARPFGSFSQLAGRDSEALITDGVYRYMRNPQYLGNLMMSLGLSLWARSTVAVGLTGMAAALHQWYVPAEEAHLERIFGAEYLEYKSRTPRWL